VRNDCLGVMESWKHLVLVYLVILRAARWVVVVDLQLGGEKKDTPRIQPGQQIPEQTRNPTAELDVGIYASGRNQAAEIEQDVKRI
jgi:hypothetical protein